MEARRRQVKIKGGVVRRLSREASAYRREAETQRAKVEAQTALVAGRDSTDEDRYRLRQQEELLREALMMIPDCDRRLAKAREELDDILTSERDLKDTEEYVLARQILNDSTRRVEADKIDA